MIRKIIGRLLPLRWRYLGALTRLYVSDARRFCRHSSLFKPTGIEALLTAITCHYHVIEKGLSLGATRPLFGREVVMRLVRLLTQYRSAGGAPTEYAYQTAIEVLKAYDAFHARCEGLDAAAEPWAAVRTFLGQEAAGPCAMDGISGGAHSLTRDMLREAARGPLPDLLKARRSVRQFSAEPVPDGLVDEAIRMAQRSPSVCNRQCPRVYVVTDRPLIQKILELQGGSRGFADQVDKLLMVGGDLNAFNSPRERNQLFFDAGLFAMTLMYALQYLGVGTCPLHWCVDSATDRRVRTWAGVDEAHTLAALIAVGSLPETFKVCASQRLPLEKIRLWR